MLDIKNAWVKFLRL